MTKAPEQQWFEMEEVRRRKVANSIWIPLRQSEQIETHGEPWKLEYREELACAGSLAIAPQHREIGNRLGWSDIGLIHSPQPHAFNDGRYKPADVYLHNDRDAIGVELVMTQSLNRLHPRRWLINQDLILALRLVDEGNVWRSVAEGYVDVIRIRRNNDGDDTAIEIRSEFLRDYLCARGLALRVVQYRQRTAVVSDPSYLKWSQQPKTLVGPGERFSTRVFPIDRDGGPAGGKVAVMKVWRTDIDNDEDVPVMGPERDDNTDFKSYSFERPSGHAFRVEGELWCEEWIEPAVKSVRVRGDPPPEELYFTVDASGERLASTQLDNEDIGRWLWFRPQVIVALLQFRGGSLSWYTLQTGSVGCSPDESVHFGVNGSGFINVYAYDIARSPQWQQRIWAGHNIAPDGPVCSELLDSQARAEPADTLAPEAAFPILLDALDRAFEQAFGVRLLIHHDDKSKILAQVHRFRGLDPVGLLSLAKDVARLTVDSFNVAALRKIANPPADQKLGSLKLLELILEKKTDAATARKLLTPLVGIYELRLGDAHLPSSRLKDAYALAQIDDTASHLSQAVMLLSAACDSLHTIREVLAGQARP